MTAMNAAQPLCRRVQSFFQTGKIHQASLLLDTHAEAPLMQNDTRPPAAHCITIYNSQDVEATHVSSDR